MTRAQRVGGVVIGLGIAVAGVATILFASDVLRPGLLNAAPCQTAAACEGGCAKGRTADCLQGGLMYFQGYGVERSTARARTLFRAACDAGDPPSCTALGAALIESDGATGDPSAEARTVLTKACDLGDAMGCNNLANLYDDGPERDPGRARALYEKACRQGSGMACSTLAKAYQAGDGVPPDPARASQFFARSRTILQGECETGNARACGQAGWLLERGLGGDLDGAKALRNYQTGCDGNDGPSCYNLSLTRRAVNPGDPTVGELLVKACKLGTPEACGALRN